jgi:Fe-S-cluster containining protein
MHVLVFGLLATVLFYTLFLLACFAVVMLLPKSFLGKRATAVLTWLPPFMRGEALRDWAAMTAERLTQKRLAGKRNAETATRLATDVEDGAMHAMLPLAEPGDLERIIACPETGQGMVGVTAPEALAIAAYVRNNLSRAEQQRIHELAAENAKKIPSRKPGDSNLPPLQCPLQGQDHVCCVYAARPLRCRILHAIAVAKEMGDRSAPCGSQAEAPDENRHEQTVAEGIEIGVTRALKSAGLSANVYELNSALATALDTPDAAERWANGEDVFHTPLA